VKKRLILLVVVLIVASLAVVAARRWFAKDGNGSIRVSGNIELTQVDIAFKAPGRLIERAVDEGDAVKKGMLVARLDREQLEGQRDRAGAALRSAESARTQQETAIAYQAETLEGQIQQRQAEVRQAEARLAELLAGSRVQDVAQASAAVDRAQAEFDRSASDWKRAQILFKNEDISAADFDQFRTRWGSARAQLEQASQLLGLVKEGPRKETIEASRAQLGQSKAALRQAEAQRLELRRRREELDTRRADIAGRTADLAIVRTQLSDTEAVSPIDGVVLLKGAEPGEVVAAGTTILTVGDVAHPWVRAYIGERDLGRVKLGDKARVMTDSFPGKVYNGRVSFISAEAEFTPKQIQTLEERAKLMYRVKIDVENPNGELKSNMPADAEILAGEGRQ
jgi:HlyD family secretion protein